MVSIPTSYNTGTYSLVASSTYSYTVSTSTPDVTFIKTDSGFDVSNNIIELEMPYDRRYLVRSGTTYYTVVNNVLSAIGVTELTSDVFLNFGVEEIPSVSLLQSLPNCELLCWQDSTGKTLEKGLVVTGTPALPQIIYYEVQNVSSGMNINKAEISASDDVLFTISCDGNSAWQYYNGNAWTIATSETEGMTAITIKNITPEEWKMLSVTASYQFRCALPSTSSRVSKIYIDTI